jgi:hypothetical protein
MARFQAELPNDLIQVFENLETNCADIFGEMVEAGAKTVYNNVVNYMKKSFKSTKSLEEGLKITSVYRTPSDDGINVFIGFYGYVKGSQPTKRHPYGKPIPLIAMAREYGTSQGEAKKPFFRKSFKVKAIEQAMQEVQDKYIKDE